MTTIKMKFSRAFFSAGLIFLIAGGGNTAFGHDTDKIVPRVGLKSVEVIHNDLRLFGISAEAIKLIDETDAGVSMLIENDPVYFLVDRETGVVDISNSSPITQEFVQLRVPPMQLFPVPEPRGSTLRAAGLIGLVLLAVWKHRRTGRLTHLEP